MEFWDAYDSEFNKIDGVTLIRGNEIPDGCFHLVCGILVKHSDGSFLLMQRDKEKHFGNMWEASAGGSVLKAETSLSGAKRELFEETGIKSDNLVKFAQLINRNNKTVYAEYLYETDCDKDSIILQEGETQDYKWVDKETLLSMPKDELLTPINLYLQQLV